MSLASPSSATYTLDQLALENSFAELPESFHTKLQPTPLPKPYLVCASQSAAELIDLDPAVLTTQEFVEVFTGNRLLPNSQPLAAVYSGHQFGGWAGQLGDGRAILLGDVNAPTVSQAPGRLELQLKGAGLTPYSRMGDGRAVLRSSIREFLCSEAMAALGIPTSRALCVTGSDQRIMRETPETAGVTTRLAASFVRFGNFEHWFYQDKTAELKTLGEYVLRRFYPQLQDEPNPYKSLLVEVTRRTAHMVAHWQAVGFMHGVMNTDNMSILGDTIDYGPFGFMEAFNAQHICNHSDHQGRYSYIMQPKIANWNCFALGQAMLPLIGEIEDVQLALQGFQDTFANKFDELLHDKLGLQTRQAEDRQMVDDLFTIMQASHVDFTLFFRTLSSLRVDELASDEPLRDLFIDRAAFDQWAQRYRVRLKQENSEDAARQVAMNKVNPKYILRNYLAQVAIDKAQEKDFSEVRRLLTVLEKPFDEQPENAKYAALPPDWASKLEVSCSS